MKSEYVLLQLELLVRLILAAVCGGAIGYERKNRGKEAGIRTHIIVSVASCLMMILSQYGFDKFLAHYSSSGIEVRLDPSRIAAQIVSGVGFLGAGMIFTHDRTITGLTTAAGVWATAGIGMSMGCGMYFIGGAGTVIIVVLQIILHKNLRFMHTPVDRELTFTLDDDSDEMAYVFNVLTKYDLIVTDMRFERSGSNLMKLIITVSSHHEVDMIQLMNTFYKNPKIYSADF